MTLYVYDGSYDGLLSALYRALQDGRAAHEAAVRARHVRTATQADLFADEVAVATNPARARRLRDALRRRTGSDALEARLYYAFLSEAEGWDRLVADAVLGLATTAHLDPRLDHVHALEALERRVRRETHRMHAFVRFEEHSDHSLRATIAPDHHVLPLIGDHFAARYPAEHWRIHDARRRLTLVHEPDGDPRLQITADGDGRTAPSPAENEFQALWQQYYRATNIPARRNLRLHVQHVPRRYWPYLTEKQPTDEPPPEPASGEPPEA
ncbi:MAG: TIGR03915 family putative DNA repair protein [Rubricoccaceae bacterium]|nr:TIGR03915 family putative DNA repair protein [Rubricoccaceae bacterium]